MHFAIFFLNYPCTKYVLRAPRIERFFNVYCLRDKPGRKLLNILFYEILITFTSSSSHGSLDD